MALAVQSFVSTGRWWTMEGSRRSLEWGEEAKFREVHSHRSRAGPAGIGWSDIKVSATIYYYNLAITLKLLSTVTYNKHNSSAFVDPIIASSTVINKDQGQQHNAKKSPWSGGRLGVNQKGTRKRNNVWKKPVKLLLACTNTGSHLPSWVKTSIKIHVVKMFHFAD